MPMKWFSALVIQEATHPEEQNQSPLFEADVILINAVTEDEARKKAEEIGKSSQHEYLNAYGHRVAWVFKEVLDIKEVDAERIGDGTEVYYVFLNREELLGLRRALEPTEKDL